MWSEARKQEKKIRGIMVDYRKRADRRKEFYERIRADPVSFLQLHGRKIKINFDIHDTTETSMMPWQGQKDNMIDRFDVRAHLDHIPPQKPTKEEEIITEPLTNEDRQVNYERYRILAQNEFLGINEEKFLAQLFIEEQFGNVTAQLETDKGSKKKNSQASAAIGYNYEENTPQIPFSQTINSIESSSKNDDFNGTKDDSEDSDLDMDISIDINKIPTLQANELNAAGRKFGMHSNDYFSFLTKDEDEKETLRAQKEAEAEKVMLVGRKSRRERRSQREKRYLGRPLSPPSYAAKEEEISKAISCEKSESRSPSPENSGKITYITSFGGEDELQPHSKISISLNKPFSKNTAGNNRLNSYAEKVKQNLDKLKRINKLEKPGYRSRSRSNSRSRHRKRSPYRKSRSVSRKRYRKSRSVSRKRRYSTSSSSSSTSRSRSRSRRRRLSRQRTSKKSYSSSSSSSSTSSKSRYSKSPVKKIQNKSNSKSKSPIKAIQINAGTSSSLSSALITEQTTVRKYYGRKRDDDSSELSVDEEEEVKSVSNDSSTNNKSFNRFPESKVNSSNVSGYTGNNPRERLKKKMQILLNKQYKADKAKEGERIEKQMQMQHEREEEMRELALKLRRRQRELRHKYGSPSNQNKSEESEEERNGNLKRDERRPRSSSSSSSSSSSHHSRSKSRDKKRYNKSPSRSRSNSRGGGSRQRRSRSRDRFEGRRRNYRDYDYQCSRS